MPNGAANQRPEALKRTFVDSGVLIAAIRGNEEVARRAIEILDAPDRVFASSEFVRLEVLPKAVFHRNLDEAKFYNRFFAAVEFWALPQNCVALAFETAVRHNLSAIDALHVAAALSSAVDEFVTTEKPSKPIHAVSGLRVTTLYP